MNHSTNTSKTPTRDASQDKLLKVVEHLVVEFERLLASELHLLKTGQADGLEAIATAKQTLVDQITEKEATLIALFDESSHDAEITALKARLMQCRIENKNNHALVMLELKHTNKSLELLRSVLNMDDLSLYSERGKVRVKREKRNIGSA